MPQYLRRRTKYVHVVFVDSTSLRTVSRYISLNQFTVFHPEEKYLDMSWPLSLISDVVLFKFSPVKTSIRPKYCSGTIQPNIQAKIFCYHHVFAIL